MANYQETPNLEFYLTSLEPGLAQENYSQSLGGYISTSLIYPQTTLSSTIGLYDTGLTLDLPSSGNWNDWDELEYISIGSEIIKVEEISSTTVEIIERGINGILNMHLSNDMVTGLSSGSLFNNNFNNNYNQYRCIAVKNVSSSWVCENVFVYIKQNSRNPNVEIKASIEVPLSGYLNSESSSWDNSSITDRGIAETYENNHFKGAYLRINNGPNSDQNRIITNYDGTNGKFTFSSVPYDYDNTLYSNIVSYEVEPSPAQRIKTGIESPVTNITRVSAFSKTDQYYPISINVDNNTDGGSLNPNEIFYIWLERTLKKGSNIFVEDNSIITVKFMEITS